jgi:hypothetical protein
MREWLAFHAGKMFVFWFNICGRLDWGMAKDCLIAMADKVKEVDQQERYRAAVKGREINGR